MSTRRALLGSEDVMDEVTRERMAGDVVDADEL